MHGFVHQEYVSNLAIHGTVQGGKRELPSKHVQIRAYNHQSMFEETCHFVAWPASNSPLQNTPFGIS